MKKLIFSRAYLINIFFLVSLLSCSTANNEKEEFRRSVPLEGQSNFRDIGNYNSTNGKTIRPGMIYRSGTFAKLTAKDVETLDSLGIKTVINFLDEGELRKFGEDKLPTGVKSFHLPIVGENNEAATVLEARQSGDFSKVPKDFNLDIHEILVEQGKKAYTKMFHILADSNNYPIVFHCSHGVHRTGTATSLILSALDVPWETVQEDYLLSNDSRKEEINKRVAELEEIAKANNNVVDKEKNKQNIEAFYIVKEVYINGTKKAIDQNYSNIEEYLISLGISNKEILNIKQILLR